MPMQQSGGWSYEIKCEAVGRSLLEMWMNLGTLEKVRLRYNAEHPEDFITYKETIRDRIHRWMVNHPEEAIEIIRKYDPNMNEDGVRGRIVFYAVRVLRNLDNFLVWAEDKPWVKPYEKHYREYYAVR